MHVARPLVLDQVLFEEVNEAAAIYTLHCKSLTE
jgi:hypothetical protein